MRRKYAYQNRAIRTNHYLWCLWRGPRYYDGCGRSNLEARGKAVTGWNQVIVPSELTIFAYPLDAQPSYVWDAFHYCLCVLMVQAGTMRLVEKVPGESGVMCVFGTKCGQFSVVQPKMSKASKAALIDVLREILEE